jgi:hypothetical protein
MGVNGEHNTKEAAVSDKPEWVRAQARAIAVIAEQARRRIVAGELSLDSREDLGELAEALSRMGRIAGDVRRVLDARLAELDAEDVADAAEGQP